MRSGRRRSPTRRSRTTSPQHDAVEGGVSSTDVKPGGAARPTGPSWLTPRRRRAAQRERCVGNFVRHPDRVTWPTASGLRRQTERPTEIVERTGDVVAPAPEPSRETVDAERFTFQDGDDLVDQIPILDVRSPPGTDAE